MSNHARNYFQQVNSGVSSGRCKWCCGFDYEHPTLRIPDVGNWIYKEGSYPGSPVQSPDHVAVMNGDRKIGQFFYCRDFEPFDLADVLIQNHPMTEIGEPEFSSAGQSPPDNK